MTTVEVRRTAFVSKCFSIEIGINDYLRLSLVITLFKDAYCDVMSETRENGCSSRCWPCEASLQGVYTTLIVMIMHDNFRAWMECGQLNCIVL